MFRWQALRLTELTPVPPCPPPPSEPRSDTTTLPPIAHATARRTLLDWRDHWLAEIELALMRVEAQLIADADHIADQRSAIERMSLSDQYLFRTREAFATTLAEIQQTLVDFALSDLRHALRAERVAKLAPLVESLTERRLDLQKTDILERLMAAAPMPTTRRNQTIRGIMSGGDDASVLSRISAHFTDQVRAGLRSVT